MHRQDSPRIDRFTVETAFLMRKRSGPNKSRSQWMNTLFLLTANTGLFTASENGWKNPLIIH
jgi:hypothetical protein